MRLLRMIWFRLRALIHRDDVNAEFDAELRDHVERETAANMRRGMSPAEARRKAMAEFGGVERFKEELRDEHSVRWLADVANDLKHGFRLLRKNKLFSGAVIGTLALGIGATSTIFAIVNGVLLRKPSYPAPEQVLSISQTGRGADINRSTHVNYLVWSESQRTLASIALYGPASHVLTGQGDPVILKGSQVTASFFDVFQARPALGRLLQASDEQPDAPPVLVLSDALWRVRFGGDSTVIGKIVTMGGRPRTIVGVMPPKFDPPAHAEYWTAAKPAGIGTDFEAFFDVIGRARAGMTPDAVRSDLQAITKRRDATRPKILRGESIIAMTVHDRSFGSVKRPLSLLFGAVSILLLIACVNVANLTMARSTARRREFGVRLALGASRWRLGRQLFVESALLAGIGGGVGMLVPVALVGTLAKLNPKSLAGVTDIHVDAAVLVFTAAATIIAALLFGLAPALTSSRSGAAAAIAEGAKSTSSKAHNALRSSLVILEIAAALTLLTGAGLFAKSFARALAISPGFEAERVFGSYLQLPRARYDSADGGTSFFNEVELQVSQIPGVQSVAQSDALPMRGFSYSRDLKLTPDGGATPVAVTNVSASFATAVGLHLVKGRFLNEGDRTGTPRVAMITSTMARQFFAGIDPLGKTIPLNKDSIMNNPTVVGVIEDTPQMDIEAKPMAQLYLASAQTGPTNNYLIIRTTLAEPVLRAAMKRVITEIEPLQPLTELFSLQEELYKAYAPRRFNSVMVNAFALLALVLAVIGLYGLMAHAVAARTRELGIRIALGAGARGVLRLVMQQGVFLTVVGILAGLAASFLLARTLSGLLYDVTTHDPFVFVAAPVTLAVVALVACYVPARRATRVNPIIALRQE